MNRSRILRWLLLPALLLALLPALTGCGGVRASSWTGLIAVEDKLYAADLQKIQELDPADGSETRAIPADWEDNSAGLFYVTPAMGDGYLIAASQVPAGGFFRAAEHLVFRFDAETGTRAWRFSDAKGPYIEGGAIGTTGKESIFVIGNSDKNVYALDADNGNLEWTFATGHRVWATPLIVDDIVYIGSMDHNLYALRLSNGEEVWRFSAGGAFAGTPALLDGTLYIGAFDNRVYAIDAQTGTERWHFPSEEGNGDSWFWGSPVAADGVIYAADVKGNVYALDAESGQELWHTPLETQVRAGPALSEDGSTLFISGVDTGTLYALNTADGDRKWAAEGEGAAYARPVVDGENVYETRIQAPYRVRALELLEGGDGYKELWIYPPETEE